MTPFATTTDMAELWRPMSPAEQERAEKLLEVISDSLRYEAVKVGKDLDTMMEQTPILANVVKSVTVDVAARTLMTSTDGEPLSQMSESALGYTVSGTYLVPGGGLFIKKSELARLGLRRQRIGEREIYEIEGDTDSSV